MKLSRTGWNNVIIISVMLIILVINATNDKLFPKTGSSHEKKAAQSILSEHSVIVEMIIPRDQTLLTIERYGTTWMIKSDEDIAVQDIVTVEQVEQLVLSWQESTGLVQVGEIVVEGMKGVEVKIRLARNAQDQNFTVYPLQDQLLLYNHQNDSWLSMPPSMHTQLLL